MDYRDRVGTLTVGDSDYDFRLASWRTSPYQVNYQTVWPRSSEIPGQPGETSADPYIRHWVIDKWSGGEGEDLWTAGDATYDISTNVRPKGVGDGLVLGAGQSVTNHDGAATFTEGNRFGIAHGLLWAGVNDTVHWWQTATGDWDQTGWSSGAGVGSPITSIIDGNDGLRLFVGYGGTNAIYKTTSASSVVMTLVGDLTSYNYAPVLRNWGGTYFILDGDDLYSFTEDSGNITTTARSDLQGSSSDYLNNGYMVWNRLSTSDKGPIWYQRLDNGQTLIHEYNVNTQTTSTIGRLPVDFATPYSIYFTHGFYFVAFRYAPQHDQEGDAYIHYFRAAQKGTAGPVRSPNDDTASKPILLGGVVGSDLVFYFDGAYWAYDLSSGGVFQIADSTTTTPAQTTEIITFGQKIFMADHDNQDEVELVDTTTYTTRTACIDSGRYDFGYPGVKKVLLDVTIVTEPLPAGTSIDLYYASDGGSFIQATGSHDTEGDTSYTWTLSTHESTVTGEDFELRLCLTGTVAVTPTVRSVNARAMGILKQRTWRLELDALTMKGGGPGNNQHSASTLLSLKTLLETNSIAKFTNPYDVDNHQSPTTHDVVIESAVLQDVETPEDDEMPVVLLREVSYV